MPEYTGPIAQVIEALKRLPGIGPKSAQRIAFHLLKTEAAEVEHLAAVIRELPQSICLCAICNNITDISPCAYCSDPARDSHSVCVVEEPANILAIERTGKYRGRYHVLHGALSPLQGVGPDQLRIAGLIERVRTGEVAEVIVATNPTVEGEATAVYLSKLLRPLGVRVTRIALGLPVGRELEYADAATVAKAMEGRKEM